MKLIITENYEEMSKIAASYFISEASKGYEKRVNFAITGGSTPKRMYEILEPIIKDNPIPYVHYYNFDEIPVKEEEGVTITSLRNYFFSPCKIDDKNIEIFSEKNYTTYDKKIKDDGGLDAIMIGLGPDGHFCGNLSGTFDTFDLGCRSYSTRLTKKLEDRIAFLCGGYDKMTNQTVTFGPTTVMNAKRIIMIVNGTKKAEILKKAIEGPIDVKVPSSILRLHPDFTIIADKEAASLLNK